MHLLLFAFVLQVFLGRSLGQLKPGGLHVCQRTVSYNTYESRPFTRVGYDNYRTCCRRFLGACTSRCTRTRSKVVHYTNSVLVQKQRLQYFCCSGWARSGDQCPLPICNPGCQNGRCTNPNVCSCKAGFVGNLCQTDVNECNSKPCDQICTNLPGTYSCSCRPGYVKTVPTDPKSKTCKNVDECKTSPCKCALNTPDCVASCVDSDGSFSCSCNSGFQLTSSARLCVDINECAATSSNHCQQKCINRPGTYRCACNPGYLLMENKRSCKDINECATLNGGCSQLCANQPGSYQCSCKRGYRLSSDKKTCIDINECLEQKPCDNKHGKCMNIPGSYQCSCNTGYKLLPDKKTCIDVNECSNGGGCQHNCTNTDGSYLCSCATGFRLHSDKHRCDDVDECTEKSSKCQQNCHNTIGSYTCSCRAGYKLKDDNTSCHAFPCQTISPPVFGRMNCSGYVTDETCNISCNTGFRLNGPQTRTCLSSSTWSGDQPECKRRQCPKIQPPTYGSVLLPCNEVFNSVCLQKCSKGYQMQGTRATKCVMRNDNVTWSNTNSTCIPTTACQPNPCLHGGLCTETSKSAYFCNCIGTGYTGRTCSVGVVRISISPLLSKDVKSKEFVVFAKPSKSISIKLMNSEGSLKFSPDIVEITHPEKSSKFIVTPSRVGIFKISYTIQGESATEYETPPANTIRVFEKEKGKVVNVPIDLYTRECFKNFIVGSIEISSTCSWQSDSTDGFVSLIRRNLKLPFSMVGIKDFLRRYKAKGLFSTSNITIAYFNSHELGKCANNCDSFDYSKKSIDYMIKHKYFPIIFSHQFSTTLPFWFGISLHKNAMVYEKTNFFAEIINGTNKNTLCVSNDILPTDNHVYYSYSPETSFDLNIMASTHTINNANKPCFMLDLNDNASYITFQKEIDYTKDFVGFGLNKVSISSFVFNPTNCSTGTDPCERHQTKVVGNAKYYFKSFSGSLSLNGEYSSQDATKIMVKGFSSRSEMEFVGNTSLKVTAKFLGNKLIIKCDNIWSKANLSFTAGQIASDVEIRETHFVYSTSAIRFIPKSNTRFKVPFNANGGVLRGIKNLNQIRLLLRTKPFIRRAIGNLENLLAGGYPKEREIVSKRQSKFFMQLDEATEVLSKVHVDIQNATIIIRDLKLAFYDMRSLIQSMTEYFQNNKNELNIVSSCRLLEVLLNKEEVLRVIPERQTSTLIDDKGWMLAYTGDICVYSLCLKNLYSSISYPTDSSADDITIQGEFTTNHSLSKRIQVIKDGRFNLKISKNEDKFAGELDVLISLFDKTHFTKMYITESKIYFQLQVSLTKNFNFTIKNEKEIKKTSWNELISTISGFSEANSNNLHDKMQYFYISTSSNTKLRLSAVKYRKKEMLKKYKEMTKKRQIISKEIKNASSNFREAETKYKQNVIELNNNQMRMKSYELGATFIEKNLSTVCTLKTCKMECIAMPECKVCQDEVTLPVKVLKCDQKTEEIKSSLFVPFDTMCDLTKYFFIPVYTGDCEEDPAMTNYRSQQMKEYMGTVQRASTVGALIGSIIPGIGTALGSFVGGIVGAIAGLFSSCDESYEVIKKSVTHQVPCTRKRLQVQTVLRPVSTCYYLERNVKSGYSEPKECLCKLNKCAAKTENASCSVQKSNCQHKRSLFLKSVATLPKVFTDLYELINIQKENVANSFIDMQRLRKRKEFVQHEYNRIHGLFKNVEQESLFANESDKNVQNLISRDICLLNKYNVEDKIENLFQIKSLNFEGTVPFVDNVQINSNVYILSNKRSKIIPFVFTFNDPDLSFEAAAKKIVYSTLCDTNRRRRSVNRNVLEEDHSFKSWYVDENLNASTVQLACMTFKRTTSFLQHTTQSLVNITKQALELNSYVNRSLSDLYGKNKTTNQVSPKLDALFSSLQVEVDTYANRTTLFNVLNQWKESSEIYTSQNNFSVCFNFLDCVESASDTLLALPTILSTPRTMYLDEVVIFNYKFTDVYASNSLNNLLTRAQNLLKRLTIIRKMSLHCTPEPEFINTDKIQDKVSVKSGAIVTLPCGDVKSVLPVKYNWKLHGRFIDGEVNDTLQLTTSLKDSGVYTCVVSSLTGSISSKGIHLNAYQHPIFASEMKDVITHLPRSNTTDEIFICNVTSSPKADIYWFHHGYDSASAEVFLPNNSSTLYVENLSVQRSGYYYCKANNTYGESISQKARLDVLKTIFARQILSMSIEITKASIENAPISLKHIKMQHINPLMEKLRMSERQNIDAKLEHGNENLKVLFTIQSIMDMKNHSFSKLLQMSSESRQNLANSAASLVILMLKNQSEVSLDKTTFKLDNNSLTYNLKLNICLPGYELHKNGFLCVQCRAGWYSDSAGKCKKCMRGYYQPSQGSKHCLPCDNSGKTDEEGSPSKKDCKAGDESKSSNTLKIALIASLVPLIIICIALAIYFWIKKKRVDIPCKETEKFPPAFQNLAYSDNEVTEAGQA